MCLNPGDIVGNRYEIVSDLGRGGFAETYLAIDRQRHNHQCAVKRLKPQFSNLGVLQAAQELFKQEAEILHRLGDRCDRIPKLFAHFEEHQEFYLVQEYIEGHPLSEELTPGRQLSEKEVIALVQDILEVLEFVQEQTIIPNENIIHRDIKPSNLIRRKRDGRIILIDFGAVKRISTLEVTAPGEVSLTHSIGTLGYMPAEQINGSPKPESDIYAVGIIGIQALTGLHPTRIPRDPDTEELVWEYRTQNVTQKLRDILSRMVRYHFRDRYDSATQVLEALNSVSQTPLANFRQILQFIFRIVPTRNPSNFPKIFWFLPGLVLAIIFYRITLPKTCPLTVADEISCGEEILNPNSSPRSKQLGVQAFAKSIYQEAVYFFKQSWEEDGRDPETLIYLNNALLALQNAPYQTIAIAVPITSKSGIGSKDGELAQEMLQGVAQAQTEVNLGIIGAKQVLPGKNFLKGQAIRGQGLRVVIADDASTEKDAEQRAKNLVKQPHILAVIGHYASEMTLATVDIYNANKLVLISPGTTTKELTLNPKRFFFRTAPNTEVEAKSLADYLHKIGQTQAAGFYNPSSPFTDSFWKEFSKRFKNEGGKIVSIKEHNLSATDFNPAKANQQINQTKETAIVLIPDGQVTNSLAKALEMIALNKGHNWIAASWGIESNRTLEIGKLELLRKLVVASFWNPLSSPNQKFSQDTEKLWGVPVSSPTALAYDATQALIQALDQQDRPSREGMQETLADSNFKAEGATGTIQFNRPKNGDRQNPSVILVHVVPCPDRENGLAFVPIEYSTCEINQ